MPPKGTPTTPAAGHTTAGASNPAPAANPAATDSTAPKIPCFETHPGRRDIWGYVNLLVDKDNNWLCPKCHIGLTSVLRPERFRAILEDAGFHILKAKVGLNKLEADNGFTHKTMHRAYHTAQGADVAYYRNPPDTFTCMNSWTVKKGCGYSRLAGADWIRGEDPPQFEPKQDKTEILPHLEPLRKGTWLCPGCSLRYIEIPKCVPREQMSAFEAWFKHAQCQATEWPLLGNGKRLVWVNNFAKGTKCTNQKWAKGFTIENGGPCDYIYGTGGKYQKDECTEEERFVANPNLEATALTQWAYLWTPK